MKFKVFRDWLQQMIYKIINPIVHGMIKMHIPLCRNERRTR